MENVKNKAMRQVSLFRLNYDHKEREAVNEVLDSKWITMGPKTLEFEREFSSFIGMKYGVALSSCTAALHIALKILGIGPGDEVIVPSLTFAATANCVLYNEATPVFADVNSLDDWTISLEEIEKKITPKTKAVIVMHYGGFGCDMDAIKSLVEKHNLYLVEDASHAPGGVHQGGRLGSIGHISCFSFYTNKNISTAEGGMLVTNNRDYSEKAKLLRSHGMTTTAHERNAGGEFYCVGDLGYNYRMDDIRASLGLVQLSKIQEDMSTRNRTATRYRERLKGIEKLRIPFANYDGVSSYYIFPALIEGADRAETRRMLNELGVQTSIHYPPVHLFRHFGRYTASLPITEEICEKTLSLPMYAKMDDTDLDYVCDCLKSVL